ncbi:hypothetical protein A2U01_0090725, partial [Trifolium medium]|nr:hypothetical protein [Trifolium medium]
VEKGQAVLRLKLPPRSLRLPSLLLMRR